MNSAIAWSSIVVAMIAAASAEFSRRAAAKANKQNRMEETRADIEQNAFERAQGYLDNVLERQNVEIKDLRSLVEGLRTENGKLATVNSILRSENSDLKASNVSIRDIAERTHRESVDMRRRLEELQRQIDRKVD